MYNGHVLDYSSLATFWIIHRERRRGAGSGRGLDERLSSVTVNDEASSAEEMDSVVAGLRILLFFFTAARGHDRVM